MKFGYSLPLCVVSATQLLVLFFSILTSYDQVSAYGLSFADGVQPSDAVTLVQPSVSSLLKTTLTPSIVLRHRCDPHTERKLRKKLKNKEKTIRKLRRRLALKEDKTKLSRKNTKVPVHHESVYCFPYSSAKKSVKRFNTNSSLTAVGLKVKHLEREVKYLQRKYKKLVREVPGVTHTRKEQALSEEKRVRELVFPNWNASEIAFASDSQSLAENLNSFRDGLIIIGSAVDKMLQSEELEKAVARKLKHLQRSRSNHRYGIYPLFKNLYKLAASLNATLPQSRLCTGTALRDKIATLEAGSEESLCGDRQNQIALYCRSYGFFTFVRRFLVHLGQTVNRLSSSP